MTNADQVPAGYGLQAEDVSVRLAGSEVLSGVSVSVGPGEVLAVAGPNGAGKSTLLRALAGLRVPDAGRVSLEGTPLLEWDRQRLGRMVAYLPQERAVAWPVSVATIVALGRLPHRSAPAAESSDDRAAVREAMATMDVTEFAARSVAQLSGGERARVLVARALAQQARYLMADEPTAGLDPAHALALFETFRRLARDGRGVVVALHDLSFAARYADWLLLLKDGRVAAFGKTRDVLTRDALAAVYGVAAAVGEIEGLPVVLARAVLT
jgi:iron complex transport system ATP-binding protein